MKPLDCEPAFYVHGVPVRHGPGYKRALFHGLWRRAAEAARDAGARDTATADGALTALSLSVSVPEPINEYTT